MTALNNCNCRIVPLAVMLIRSGLLHTREEEHLKRVHHNLVCNYGVGKAKRSRAGAVFVLVIGFHPLRRKF